MGLSRRAARAALMMAVLALTACDAGASRVAATPVTSPPTEPRTTTADPTTTPAPATEPPTTAPPSTTASPSTVPRSTTIDEDAVRAQIAADVEAADARLVHLLADPTQPGAVDQVSLLAAGEYRELITSRLLQLIADGQRVVLGDPPLHQLTVETVTLTGPSTARIVFCRTDNSMVVDAAGATVFPSDLGAVRDVESVVLSESGWLQSTYDRALLEVFDDQTHCAVERLPSTSETGNPDGLLDPGRRPGAR